MLIKLDNLYKKYRLDITGVLHVGAHFGEEALDYKRIGVHNVVWIEANKDLLDKLIKNVPQHHRVINAVVGENDGEQVTFHKANNSQSSSILELGTHKTAHPEVKFLSEETRFIERLDSIYNIYSLSDLNFINLDIQGAELSALKGLGNHLSEFDYIYSEVNREELYVGCCLIEELDRFLKDFKRVETSWTNFGWGDAFYIRNKNDR